MLPLIPAALISLGTAHAATVVVTDGNLNQFGDIGGFALDFDTTTGLTANYEPDLTSQLYTIDSVTLYRGTDASTGTIYLGVYSTYAGGTLGGFQGVSNNTVILGDLAASQAFTFNFSNITVTPEANPGQGNDIRYFVFQTGTTALTAVAGQSTRVPIRRIDGENGQFNDELSTVIRSDTGEVLASTRAVEYSATITPVPEPTALGLLGLAGVALASRRRRQS
jgi:hypothetical protein